MVLRVPQAVLVASEQGAYTSLYPSSVVRAGEKMRYFWTNGETLEQGIAIRVAFPAKRRAGAISRLSFSACHGRTGHFPGRCSPSSSAP